MNIPGAASLSLTPTAGVPKFPLRSVLVYNPKLTQPMPGPAEVRAPRKQKEFESSCKLKWKGWT